MRNEEILEVQEQTRNLRLARKWTIGVVAALVVIIMVLGSLYTLDANQAAVVTTFGRAETVTKPGLHLKLPFVQKVKKLDTTIQGMAIGYDPATDEDILDESIMISSDYNFLNIDFYLTYQITDPIKYSYASDDPIMILKSSAQAAIRTTIASYKVDSVLTTGKAEIQSNIRSLLTDNMQALDIGITVNSVSIQDAEPPTDSVKQAFQAVEDAKQGKVTALNNANKNRNERIPEMQAKADQIVQNAQAEKEKRIAEAKGQVARFNAMYEEYVKFPVVTKERMFYEAMEDVLPNMKVVIQGKNSGMQTVYPVEKFTE